MATLPRSPLSPDTCGHTPSKPPLLTRLVRLVKSNYPPLIFTFYAVQILTYALLAVPELSRKELIVTFMLGCVWESWLEYSAHRFIQHFVLWVPSSWRNERMYYVLHGHHHKHPHRLPFFPFTHSFVLCFGSLALFLLFVRPALAYGTSLGGVTALVLFELSHWWIHEGIDFWPCKPMETFHLLHHTSSRAAYGFVTPFWDFLFGTVPKGFLFPVVPLPIPIVPFMISGLLHRFWRGPLDMRFKPVATYD